MSYHQHFPDPPPSRRPWDAEPQHWGPEPQAWNEPQHWGGAPQPWDTAPPPVQPGHTAHLGTDHGGMNRLRGAYRRLRRVATLTALGYFVLFLLLSGFAPGLMTSQITGGLTIGVLLGLLTLPVALAAIAVYERIARRRVDPLAASIREQAEHAAQTAAPRQDRQGRPARPGRQYPAGGAHA
ncbi:DUF485 domain-containing protein [Streptomyces sp. NPDC002889]|uniref:DUF485 domain-containing protein n=1 Tax=Streptomyces sp. NPDC002889 TaxID=3364669 RepID=UPI0036AC5C00